MKHEINMKPGFVAVSIYSGEFDYIECINFGWLNEVVNHTHTCTSNPSPRRFVVGVWQPKGTKLKRDAEKL